MLTSDQAENPRAQLHEQHEEDRDAEPDERVGPGGAQRHEEGDAAERADDVDGVGAQRRHRPKERTERHRQGGQKTA